MAGLFDGLVKGIVNLAPQDNPDVMAFNAQSELKEIGEKENELFVALGRKVYEDSGKDAYPEFAAQLDELKVKKEEVQNRIKQIQVEKEAREQTSTTPSGIICPDCGASNNGGSKFCSGCGVKLPEAKKFCTACGAEIADGMRFCSSCGAVRK